MEKELDILIQKISAKQKSQISKTDKNIIGHHLIHRGNELFRWDLDNIMFITVQEHTNIHSIPNYEIQHLTEKQKEFKELNRNKSLKDYLLKHGLIKKEFMQERKEYLTNKLNELSYN